MSPDAGSDVRSSALLFKELELSQVVVHRSTRWYPGVQNVPKKTAEALLVCVKFANPLSMNRRLLREVA